MFGRTCRPGFQLETMLLRCLTLFWNNWKFLCWVVRRDGSEPWPLMQWRSESEPIQSGSSTQCGAGGVAVGRGCTFHCMSKCPLNCTALWIKAQYYRSPFNIWQIPNASVLGIGNRHTAPLAELVPKKFHTDLKMFYGISEECNA